MTSKRKLRADLVRAKAEAADWRSRYDELAQAFSAATGSARYVTLPADQFDQLMAEADQTDIATKLAEAAVKPREFRTYGKPAQFGEPGTYLINSDQECSGNSGIPGDTESGNFPNIEVA